MFSRFDTIPAVTDSCPASHVAVAITLNAKASSLKKALGETQTLRAGRSKAEPKIFAPPQTPSRGAGSPQFNQLEMVTTCTYRPSLVKIDARNFELSW